MANSHGKTDSIDSGMLKVQDSVQSHLQRQMTSSRHNHKRGASVDMEEIQAKVEQIIFLQMKKTEEV